MKNIKRFLLIIVVAMFALACQEDLEPGGTKVQDLAGEWWVKYEVETSPGVFDDVGGGYYKMMTYNTAADAEEIWIDDLEHFWEYKVKAPVDLTSKSFAVSGAVNATYESTVTIESGVVVIGGGRSVSGVQTDSIHFLASFDDDAPSFGTKYRVSGHRRTGFLEDELE
ncbi:MAG: lipid-binding protein [Chryseolinea sp.]